MAKDFEPDDPFQPIAMALSTPGYDGLEAMARCFIEEFALMGWTPPRIFRLFTLPEFAASYAVYRERGADYVRRLIADVFGDYPVAEPEPDVVRMTPASRPAAAGREGESSARGL